MRDGNVTPNAAHRALAALEREFVGEVLLVTQNIDDLHDRAGSRNLIHMHGELFKVRCAACDRVHEWREDIDVATRSPCCGAAGKLRPYVVWFGEMPLQMERIDEMLSICDLFVSIGTSGTVYPAAGFVQKARLAGARTVELNLEPSDGHSLFVERQYGPATQLVPAFVERLLADA